MATTNALTVAGSFDDPARARAAVDELLRAGFRPDQLGWIHKDPARAADRPVVLADTAPEEGAAIGAVTGGSLGGLLGAALALTVPAVGPVLAAGVLAGLLSGATLGIVSGGLVGALIGMGMPHEEAEHFEREVQAGRYLVTVQAGDRYTEAAALLSRSGAYSPGSAAAIVHGHSV